jgi:hypothetical protein
MSLFAHIINGIVTNVIVAEQWFIDLQDGMYIKSEDNGIIKNIHAGIGDMYDEIKDVFIKPQPYPSWILNESSLWEAPTIQPDDNYVWNEDSQSWEELDTSSIQ